MKTVKLVARPNTWFKEGTEVYDYDSDYSEKKHITLEYWNECKKHGNFICCRGIRISEMEYEHNFHPNGTEYVDGECGSCDEFDAMEID